MTVIESLSVSIFNTDRIFTVDENRHAIGFVEDSLRLPEKCLFCSFLKLCRGGCRRNRFTMEEASRKETEEHLNRFCESCRRFFEARMEEMFSEIRS